MRTASFEVPAEVIGDFTDKLTELELENSIVGRTQDDEIEVLVNYEKEDSQKIDELEAYLEELTEDLYNDDEDEEQDDN